MLLLNYRKLRKLTRAAAGKQLGVSGVTIYRWETGRQMPRRDDLQRISEWSAGAVQANDFVNIQPEGKQ